VFVKVPTPHCYATSCSVVISRVMLLSVQQSLSYNDVTQEHPVWKTSLQTMTACQLIYSLIFVFNFVSVIFPFRTFSVHVLFRLCSVRPCLEFTKPKDLF
jgi:hypothetical protein